MGANHQIILLTKHRRENIGKPLEEIFQIIPILVNEYKDIEIVFPVQKNLKVHTLAKKYLSNIRIVQTLLKGFGMCKREEKLMRKYSRLLLEKLYKSSKGELTLEEFEKKYIQECQKDVTNKDKLQLAAELKYSKEIGVKYKAEEFGIKTVYFLK